jgi:hypothetical protein
MCYYCQRYGHIKRACLKLKSQTSADESQMEKPSYNTKNDDGRYARLQQTPSVPTITQSGTIAPVTTYYLNSFSSIPIRDPSLSQNYMTVQQQPTQTNPQSGGVLISDHTLEWAAFYRSIGMVQQAEILEANVERRKKEFKQEKTT